jgi:hypothetical protein
MTCDHLLLKISPPHYFPNETKGKPRQGRKFLRYGPPLSAVHGLRCNAVLSALGGVPEGVNQDIRVQASPYVVPASTGKSPPQLIDSSP